MAVNLTPDMINDIIFYDENTGEITWKHRPEYMFIDGEGRYTANRNSKVWNTQFAGKKAFTSIDESNGYIKSTIFGKKVYAHRLIWALKTGSWPKHDIDHINGIRHDNRWKNLRAVTRSSNAKNAALKKNNKSGYHGISQIKETGRWRAMIHPNYKSIHLGCFDTIEEAIIARKKAEEKYGYHKNHGRK